MQRIYATALATAAMALASGLAHADRGKPTLGPQGPNVLIGKRPLIQRPPKPQPRAGLRVAIDTPYQIFANQGTYIHVAAWQVDGRPATNATVFVGKAAVGSTDRHGTLVFRYPPKGSGKKSATGASSITVVDAKQRSGSVPFNPYLRTASFASDHLFVYTDRGVYRPGETVHIRTIGWHLGQDYAPLSGAAIAFELKGKDGELISGGQRKTNSFGIAALDLEVPTSAREGLYTLAVNYKRERQSTRLQVRDFKPPPIRIDHTLGRFITADQTKLDFTLTLTPASGGKLGSAEVELAAVAGGKERIARSLRVSGNGPHPISITATELAALKQGLSEGKFATITITIRDDLGRTATLKREMRYSANPYVAVLETDKDQYSTGDPIEIVAKVSDLDGVPQRRKPVTLAVGADKHGAVTDDSGTALFSLKMGTKSATAELFIAGVAKPVATASLRWVDPRAMSSHIADPIIKERGRAHVVVKFPTHIVPAEKVVHMDVVDTSGAIVNAVLLPVKKGKDGYVAAGSFTAPTWGSMLLTFFALGRDTKLKGSKRYADLGLLTEGQNLVVHPDRTLTITLDGLPDKAKPGSSHKLGMRVSDPRGRPVKAAIGIAGVDRRVLSLKDPLEITPMDQFYNPELRTMSTTGSKILSWPVVSRNWGGRQQDVALPPFPFLAGGDIARRRRLRGKVSSKKPSKKTKSYKSSGSSYDFDDDPVADELMAEKPAEPGLIGHGGGGGSGSGSGYGVGAGRGRGKPAARPKPVVITIRSKFPETFLWKSDLVADPRAELTADLPDAISEQDFIIVASDENGGVGLLRKRIEVSQPVFVRADFPERLRAGESVAVPVVVHNRTAAQRDFSIELAVAGQPALSKPLSVAANSVAATVFDVLVSKPGSASYRIEAKTPGYEDHVAGKVDVAAQGVPTLFSATGIAAANQPFSAKWNVAKSATGNQAWVSIGFPSVTSALVGADAIGKLVKDDPLAVASDLLSAALVLDYARRNKLTSPRLADLEIMVREAVAMLQLYQNPDGSFAYWRNQKKSPYITAWVLEGLLAARALAMPVSDQTLSRTATWLTDQFLADGLVDVSDVAFWEGDTTAVRTGLSAEIFDVLTMVPAKLRDPRTHALIDKLAISFATYLERADPDALAAGRALQGLARLGKLDKSKGRTIIANLITRRDHGHWEPSWFHAYGGTIEASVAMLAAIEAIDPSGFASEKRDAIAYVMATREAWGQWHNERGTAAAIRALLICGSPAEEIPGTVTVSVDGKVVRTVKIDPADPYLSAIALNHVDLGEHIAAGDHRVEVTYSGKLSPTVALGVRSWNVANSREASRETAGFRTKLWVAAPSHSRRGDAVDVRLDIGRPEAASVARLLIPESSLMEVDLTRLAANIALNPTLARYRLTDAGVEIELTPRANPAGAIIPFKAVRAGHGQWPTMLIAADGETLTVSAGELHVAP